MVGAYCTGERERERERKLIQNCRRVRRNEDAFWKMRGSFKIGPETECVYT